MRGQLEELSRTPTVSVVMPAYNQAGYIGQAIGSVLAQSFADLELIVIDDGSTDGTQELVAELTDQRLRYVCQENQERSAARNAGLALARGGYLAFLDADDFWTPRYLERQLAALGSDPEAGLSHTWTLVADREGRVVRQIRAGASEYPDHQAFLKALLVANRFLACSVVVRRACLEAVGGFDSRLRQAEDWDLWLRIALRYPVVTVPEALACQRRYNSFLPERMVARGVQDAYPYIVEKAFGVLDSGSPLQALRPVALGQAYWRAAWALYAVGRVGEGQDHLRQAIKSDPGFFGALCTKLIESIGHLSDELYDLYTPLDEALDAVKRFFDHLPPEMAHLRRLRRPALGQTAGVSLFRNQQTGNRAAVRRAAVQAMWRKPSWLRNRGFVSIALHALLPPGFSRAAAHAQAELEPDGA